jgi:PST family polysaccharide transporter
MARNARSRSRRDIVRAAFVLTAEGLGSRVVSGAGFTLLGTLMRLLVTLGSVAVLARLLAPSDFGYIAMATVVTELAALFSNFGLTNILIQRPVANRLQFDTVFWVSTGIGTLAATVIVVLSFVVGSVFGDENVGPLLRVLSLTFLFGGLTAVHEAVIARLMLFRAEFAIQMTLVVARALTGIILALLGFGAWSLAIAAVAGSFASLVAYAVVVPYLPRFRFSGAYLAETWSIGSSYLGRGILAYVDTNVDIALVGRYFGAASLGFYQNARSLTDEVRSRLAIPLQRVLFPAFSAIQSNLPRLQDTVVRSGRLLAAIVMPVGIGASAIADELVPVLYGEKWVAMVPVVVFLGVGAAIRGSAAIASPIFNSTNRIGLALRHNFVATAIDVCAVVLALPHGIVWVAAALAAGSLYALAILRSAFGLIGLGWSHALRVLGPPAIAAATMWGTVYLARYHELSSTQGVAARMAVHIALGAAVYSATLHILSREYLREFAELGRRLVGRG